VGVEYPKQGKAGGVYLYRNGSLVAEDTNFPAVRSHNQDATHKKWEASFHPMNGEFGAYSAVSVSDMALFDVGPKAVLDGLPLYEQTGQFPAREMPPSARRHLIVAYDGANDGTQYIPSDGYVRDMIHGLHYVDGAAEEKSFDARVPIPPYGLSFSADLPVIPPASDPPPG
jgi:hypothetical protein